MSSKKKEAEKKEVEITLSIIERITIPVLFPQEMNRVEIMHKRNVNRKIEIGSEEASRIKLKATPNGGMYWEKESPLTITLTDLEVEFLKDQITRIDKQMDEDKDMKLHESVWNIIDRIKAL